MERINPSRRHHRRALRLTGAVLVAAGVPLVAVGLISFFSSLGSFGPPRYFWCAVLGLPMVGAGMGLLKLGFMETFTRYYAGETAPVAKDAFNYLGEGTTEGVRHISRAFGSGLSEGLGSIQKPDDTAPPDSVRDRLVRLEDLRRDGLISQQEFETQRERILSEL